MISKNYYTIRPYRNEPNENVMCYVPNFSKVGSYEVIQWKRTEFQFYLLENNLVYPNFKLVEEATNFILDFVSKEVSNNKIIDDPYFIVLGANVEQHVPESTFKELSTYFYNKRLVTDGIAEATQLEQKIIDALKEKVKKTEISKRCLSYPYFEGKVFYVPDIYQNKILEYVFEDYKNKYKQLFDNHLAFHDKEDAKIALDVLLESLNSETYLY